ncbi:MAG TPA: DUF4159 domain-containing protein [Verrucomicrobiae bacterium]|nr:DUF4159 domain-containing protein [Verrucomicrobiae bacterium]
MKKSCLIGLTLLLALGAVFAQRYFRGGFGRGGYGGDYVDESTETPRDVPEHGRAEDGSLYRTPYWTNTPGFDKDVFTFVRIKRDRIPSTGGSWFTDTPDSDLNLAYRLQQLTSIKVNPDGLFLRLTDKRLFDYPFIYMVEPGSLYLSDEEVAILRKYLLNGGFLWLDDFWGNAEWNNVEQVFKRVFPNRSFVELPLSSPLYHCVFDIKAKNQIPGIDYWERSGGDTSERGSESSVVHHRVILDDKGRIMVFATHDTDNGDGWEREGASRVYFERFSEKTAYPLAINVIFYVMTH